MISGMIGMDETGESQANTLCKSCGLCCTGHLFIWTKLRSTELDSIEALGLPVLRSVPSQRGFNQPCPLWQGQCTIYHAPTYPRFCRTYKCKLLKNLLDGNASLPDALTAVKEAKVMIHDVESLLPDSPSTNFRERLAVQLERISAPDDGTLEFWQKANGLLVLYEEVFGVDDVIEKPDEE
jgi:hypothetical protein